MFFDNTTHSGFFGNVASVYLSAVLVIAGANQVFEEENRDRQMRDILDEQTYLQDLKPNTCVAVSPNTERKVSVQVFNASPFERTLRGVLPFVASVPERRIELGVAPEYVRGPCEVFKEGIAVFQDFRSAADANASNRRKISQRRFTLEVQRFLTNHV